MKNLKHPSTLPVFFLTEMWERYGFYVVQTLLAIYLAIHFSWPDKKVYALIGSFTALTYLSPFVGGWIADKYLGQKVSVLLGALILFFSYIILSFSKHIPTLITALSSVAIGTGLLKPNIATLLGNQYEENSTLRENGFTIFYLGITTGIILGTTLPSIFYYHFGWQIAFLSAALGLSFSMFTFIYGMMRNKIEDYSSNRINDFSNQLKSFIILGSLWFFNREIMLHPYIANMVFPGIGLIVIAYLIYCMFTEDKTQARRTLIILFLCSISVMFWSFYFQMFMSLTLFIIRAVKLEFLGIQFTPPYYVAIESLGMIVVGYFLTRKHHKDFISVEQRAKAITHKFVIALGLMLVNYLLIDAICYWTPAHQKISPLLIIPGYLIISKAELLLSPIGTSAMTILSCRKKVSTMMGIFFVSLGLGAFFSGKLATLTAVSNQNMSIELLKQHYSFGFLKLSGVLLGLFLLSLLIKSVSNKILEKQLDK